MPASQAILDDVKLRYRHSFTDSQVLVWFNEEQRELFDILELDSDPYAFETVEGENFYPFPTEFDVTKIKVVSLQIDDSDTPNFIEIPNKRNDNHQYAAYGYPWWAVVSDAFYLSYRDSVPGDRTIYVYTDADPVEVTTSNLDVAPSLPTRFQEILKLGLLKRIAGARKDTVFYTNYDAEREQKISDILLDRKLKEPEWTSATDVMPRISRYRNGRNVAVVITQTE